VTNSASQNSDARNVVTNHFVASTVNTHMGMFYQVANRLPDEGVAIPTIRALIADSDIASCREVRALLSAETGVQVIGECMDAARTVAMVQALEPDLLLLDIDLLDPQSSEALDRLRTVERPILVFTSSHHQDAIRAFEARALDYLVKPIDRERLHVAVERTRAEVLKAHDRRLSHRILHMLAGTRTESEPGRRLIVKSGSRVVFVDAGDIDWIEAAGNYVRLRTARESYLMREGISRIADRLDPRQFVRIHRSTIVNIRRIKELQPCNRGEYMVILKDGKELSCSRGYRAKLQALITAAS
jgi:two-component system, LytTR family, response regulator